LKKEGGGGGGSGKKQTQRVFDLKKKKVKVNKRGGFQARGREGGVHPKKNVNTTGTRKWR